MLEALRVAEELDDVDRTMRAATMLSTNNLWQSGVYGGVHDEVVTRLRWVLDRLPPGDSPARCRAMVTLASEIYYSSTRQEREALCEEAVAMARRLDDPQLLLWALVSTVLPVWRPGSARQRMELTEEAAGLAERLGDGVALSTALVQYATAATELGCIDGLEDRIARARTQAEKVHHQFAELVLDGLEISWRAMRDEFDAVEALIAHMAGLHEQISVQQSSDALMGAVLMKMIWSDQAQLLLDILAPLEHVTVLPVDASLAAMLARIGRVEEARQVVREREMDLSPDWWFSTMVAAMAAEAALRTATPELAGAAYDSLSGFAGQPASAGSGTFLGPVDMFLAMAAAAAGERDLATQHAREAVRLCEEWRVPVAAAWFRAVREEFAF